MKGRKAEMKVIDGGLVGVPMPPPHIPPEMVAEWNAIAADLIERELLADSMTGLLATYITALWSCRKAEAAIAEHGVMVNGGAGALKPNPACGMLARSQSMVARLAAELGLTPAARSKPGFQKREEEDDLFSRLGL